MKETVTEYEEIEKEVERVYCDECGDECTDSHRIRPQEVCEGCSSRDYYATMRQFMSAEMEPAEKNYTVGQSVVIGFVSPVVMVCAALDAIYEDDKAEMERGDALFLIATTIGFTAWVLLGLFVVTTV